MRSIRLSLTVYLLALLGVALGAASLLAYRTTRQTLEEKEEAARSLVEARYKEECRKEQERLDKALFQQARTVAQFILFQKGWSRLQEFYHGAERWRDEEVRRSHQTVELLSAAALPHAGSFGTLSFWASEPNRWSFPRSLGVLLFPEIKTQIRLQISDPLPPID